MGNRLRTSTQAPEPPSGAVPPGGRLRHAMLLGARRRLPGGLLLALLALGPAALAETYEAIDCPDYLDVPGADVTVAPGSEGGGTRSIQLMSRLAKREIGL